MSKHPQMDENTTAKFSMTARRPHEPIQNEVDEMRRLVSNTHISMIIAATAL